MMNIDLNKDHVKDYRARKIVVLLIVLFAFIVPNNNKHEIDSVSVQFVENLDRIDDWAWAAALLAYLYNGMRRYKNKKNYIDGNLWVLLVTFAYTFIVLFYCAFVVIYLFLYLSVFLWQVFFIIRIKKLQTALGIKLKNPPESVKHGEPWLPWIVREIDKKTHNHYAKWTIDSMLPITGKVHIELLVYLLVFKWQYRIIMT